MNPQADNPWIFGFPIATLWGARVRLNPLYLLLWIWFSRLFGWPLGTLAFGLTTLLILFHEYCHVFAARWTGGDADDVVIWPFGGLALCRRAQTFQSEFFVPAAGPLFHLVVAVVLLPFVWSSGQLAALLNPIDFPSLDLRNGIGHVTLLMLFALNIRSLYFNLLPMLPLDGSSMWHAVARQQWEPMNARTATLIVSAIAHLVMFVVSFNIPSDFGLQLLSFSYMLLPITVLEFVKMQVAQVVGEFGDSGAFQLYGDEEEGISTRTRPPGMFERWRIERDRKRQEREEQERIETENRLDALLEKINQTGIESLSDGERKFLKKASARYRDQGKPS